MNDIHAIIAVAKRFRTGNEAAAERAAMLALEDHAIAMAEALTRIAGTDVTPLERKLIAIECLDRIVKETNRG